MNHYRLSVGVRAVGSAVLLGMLAVCGYVGSRPSQVQAVSVPVVQATIHGERSGASMNEVKARLHGEREREIAMLEDVIEDTAASQGMRRSALEQKMRMVQCMDMEARTEASLAYMGFADSAVICAVETVTVFLPLSAACDEASRVQIIDAAATQTGAAAADIKIILAKI